MQELLLAHGGEEVTLASYGTDWLYLLVPVAVLTAIIGWLWATGTSAAPSGFIATIFACIGSSLERVTGLPSWCAAGLGFGAWSLLVAVIGFLWDVAWHIDYGRDEFIFTPSHTMILVGLGSIIVTAVVSTTFATLEKADVGRRLGRFHIPHGALALGVLGVGAVSGFPLDELWHRNYGVDVTMWGPTHLLMISGASFTPLAMWLVLREAEFEAKKPAWVSAIKLFLAGAVVVGLSTFQAEFDFGVPQFQQLYHPVLIAAAGGMGLAIARTALGRGGALVAVVRFIAIRGMLGILLGTVLNHTVARFPLYLGAALAVELGALLTRRFKPLITALVTGALVGTLGLAAEWGWMEVWGRHPWGTSLFPGVLVAVGVAVAAAVLGTAMGRILAGRSPGINKAPLVVAGVVLIAGLILPLPRRSAPIEATVTTERVSANAAELAVTIDPPTAVKDPDFFEVMSWQGGSQVNTPLVADGAGRYVATEPVPVGGNWKTLVRIARKDLMVAVAVFMPEDPVINADAIPVVPERTSEFRRDTELLMREAHEGAAWPAAIAYTSIAIIALIWIAAIAAAFISIARKGTSSSSGNGPRPMARTRARTAVPV